MYLYVLTSNLTPFVFKGNATSVEKDRCIRWPLYTRLRKGIRAVSTFDYTPNMVGWLIGVILTMVRTLSGLANSDCDAIVKKG